MVVRDDALVLEKPSRQAQVRCMARIGNTSAAFRTCLDAEFPRFSVQRLLGCFVAPSARLPEALTPGFPLPRRGTRSVFWRGICK